MSSKITPASMSESNLYSPQDINTNDSYNLDSISPLQLTEIKSATPFKNSKKHRKNSKKRSQSAIPIRRRQYRDLEMKLQIYQEKITSIQDDAEDTEKEIRQQYEIQLLHLETKYLHQKNENISLQNEIEKLRQKLSVREATANYPSMERYNSNNSIIMHSSNDITTQTSNSSVSSSNSSSSSTANATTSSSSLDDMEINCNVTYSNGETQEIYLHGNKYNKKRKRMYKKHSDRKNNQPTSFCQNMLMLFRPPNLMCSGCSNNTTIKQKTYRRKY